MFRPFISTTRFIAGAVSGLPAASREIPVVIRTVTVLILLCGSLVLAPPAAAVAIPTVPIGNPGNPDDATGFGAVDHASSIGMTEITNAQYVEIHKTVDEKTAHRYGIAHSFAPVEIGTNVTAIVTPAHHVIAAD
jgi:hypothetical protein